MKRALGQRFSRPDRHQAQAPQVQPSHGTPTRSPDRQPGDAGANPGHLADDLVPRDDRVAERRQLAVGDVEVGPADAAGQDAEQHVVRAGLRRGPFARDQWCAGTLHHHGQHARTSFHRPHLTSSAWGASTPIGVGS